MKKIFITDFDRDKYELREIFSLARPFLHTEKGIWEVNVKNPILKNLNEFKIKTISSPRRADLILISEPLNHSHDKNKYKKLDEINKICQEKNILAYGFIDGDYGKVHPRFSNIVYYRMGGFKSQLDKNNKGFFFLLSDQLKKIFNRDEIFIKQKKAKPTIGFCGRATSSIPKYFYEKLKLAQVNIKRITVGDFNFEPLFSSAFERQKILNSLCQSKDINTNFIFREKYRAGAVTELERRKTTLEYYNNIIESDYIICLRGSGNFSVRLFETLMMGRIPIFINTDCLLPLEDDIDWKKHVVWVDWNDRKNIAEIVFNFHNGLTNDRFINIQKDNREFWKSKLTVENYLRNVLNF